MGLDSTLEHLRTSYRSVGKEWRECHDARVDRCANLNTRIAERKLANARKELADAIGNIEDARRLLQ